MGARRRGRRSVPIVDTTPFRGLRYDPERVEPSAVIAPPYDVVGEAAVAALHARSPHNVAHIESPRSDGDADRYARAAALLGEWERSGVLLREATPGYYVYEQRTTIEGQPVARRCFFARLRLSPFEDGLVRPHERTMSGPKADRLALLRATRTNVSPIFVMYSDTAGTARSILANATEAPPAFVATDDRGDEHRLWIVAGASDIEALTAAVAASNATIADGHHRYETALAYLEERGAEAAGERYVLAGLVAEDEPGLVVLPTHRLVPDAGPPGDFAARLGELYDIQPLGSDLSDLSDPSNAGAARRLWEQVQAGRGEPGTFGLLGLEGPSLHLLRARSPATLDAAMPAAWSAASRGLDVLILNETILRPLLGIDAAAFAAGRVEFNENVGETWEWTQAAQGRLAFLVNATRVDQVVAVADAAEVLPQKSTYYYPKLATGMVLNPLD
ncbi:MAG: DUF1015 domain-containing protein [Chloroflexi bacterium]|nr:DUF1015 domain-containing protein [Chloroflexota bacterium]